MFADKTDNIDENRENFISEINLDELGMKVSGAGYTWDHGHGHGNGHGNGNGNGNGNGIGGCHGGG